MGRMPEAIDVHPDRLFPPQPEVRDIARRIHASTAELPIISPHSHVPAQWLAEDTPFPDPASLLVVPDHYVLRLLHAAGAGLSELGRGPQGPRDLSEDEARGVWRILCENYHLFRGTPVKYWLNSTLGEVFGLTTAPSARTADRLYDEIAQVLQTPAFRPRALFERFGISVLATTDDPLDDLAHHRALAADPSFSGRVIPTFRPDRFLELARPGFADLARQLGEVADVDTGDYAGYIAAIENRR